MNRRFFLLSFLILLFTTNFVFAQTDSKKLSYQAVVRNANNELLVNETLSVVISVLDGEGNLQYSETHASVQTNQNGLMWLMIGEGTVTFGTMDDVVWKNATIQSSFTMPDGAVVEQNTPVTSMPLALYAEEVDTAFLQDFLEDYNLPIGEYLTQSEMDDTLGHYYTDTEIDDTLGHYYTGAEIDDTLGHYYTGAEIDDTLSHYYTGAEIDDTLSHYLTGAEIDDTLGHYYTGAEIDDTLSYYYTKAEIDDTLSHYYTSAEIDDTLSQYYTNAEINDTLNSYYTKNEIDTAKANIRSEIPTVYDSTITIKQGDNVLGTFTANQSSNVTITIPKRAEQVQANWDEDNIDSASFIRNKPTNVSAFANDAGYLTRDSALVQTMRDSINDLDDRIEDSNAELSSIATLAINTKYRLDSLAQVVSLIGSINDGGGDLSELINTIATIGMRLQAFQDTICNAVMSCNGIKTMRDSIQEVDAELSQLKNRVNTFHANVCDSVMQCVSGWVNDTLGYYYTKTEVDTAKTNIRGEINAVGMDVTNLAASVDTAKAAIRGEIDAVGADVTNLAASVDTAKAAIRGEIDAVGADVTNLAASVDTAKAAIRGEIDAVDENVSNLAASVDTAKAAIRGEIDAVGANVTNLAASVDTAKAAIRGEIDAVGANVANLAYSVDTAKDNIRGEIPTVYDSVITIKQGNNVLGTFTANQSSNVTINIPTKADQVQANWTEINTDSASFIRNKPTQVSAFDNDAGYLTSEAQVLSVSHDTLFLTGGSFVKLPQGFDGDYNSLTNKPTIPTVPTNVSAFVNDAGYLTAIPDSLGGLSVESDPIFSAWDKNYNDLINTPTIPTVPTQVSAFDNDAGYLTSEAQVLSVSHDTLFLTGGSFVKLPQGFDGDYNSLTNKPTIPTVPTNVSAFVNDAGYLTAIPDSLGGLSVESDPIFSAWDKNYNDLINTPTIPTVPTNVSAFVNDAGYLTAIPDSLGGLSVESDPIFSAWDKNYNDLTNKPQLFSGSYNDLTNKPTLFSGNYNDLTNKPTFAMVATSGSYNDLTNKPNLATVATSGNYNDLTNKPTLFSGNYNDLTNKPTIPTVPTNVGAFTNDVGYMTSFTETDPQFNAWNKSYNDLTDRPELATVATTGDYNDLSNKPTIPTVPTNISAFTNDAGYLTAIPDGAGGISIEADPIFSAWDKNYNDLTNKPQLFSGSYNDLTNKPNLATVATSGSYNDLTNKPNLATVATSGNYSDLNGKPTLATVATSGSYSDLSGTPTLATVATTGSYNDLTNKPALFSGNYSDLSGTPNLATVATSGSYSDLNGTPNLATVATSGSYNDLENKPSIPTKTSQLTNDSGFLTEHQDISGKANTADLAVVAISGSYSDLENKPSIPTKTSQLTNDLGFLTEHQDISGKANTADLAAVATSGSYNDLENKPSIPTKTSQLTNDSGFLTEHQDISGKANTADLAAVATSGSYNDLENKPSIPTKTSQLTNDSGFLTEHQDISGKANTADLATVATTGSYNDLTNKPTIPAAQVNADWAQTSTESVDYINNKPNIRDSVNTVVTDSLNISNSKMNKAIDTIAANVVADSLNAFRESLRKTTDNTLLPRERSKKFMIEEKQDGDVYIFKIDSKPHSSYLVKIYINGVLVGDNDNSNNDAVLTVSDNPDGDGKISVTYNSEKNEGYKLQGEPGDTRKQDKVVIYWFEGPNANAGSGE